MTRMITLACFVLAGASAFAFGGPDEFGGYASTHIVVRIDRGVGLRDLPWGGVWSTSAEIAFAATRWGVTGVRPFAPTGYKHQALAERLGLTRTYLLDVPKGTQVVRMASDFATAAGIEFAELDGIGGIAYVPNDPNIANCWGLNNTGQSGGTPDADIDAFEAWDTFRGSDNIILAVLDTGVDPNHDELRNKTVQGRNTNNNSNDTMDRHSHGTHCSGTAAAWGDNARGFAGVSFGGLVMPMKVLTDGGSGSEAQCGAGMVWAADNGAHVLSMSLQYYTGSTGFRDSVNYAWNAGCILIAAAGNGQGQVVAFPARFDNCRAISATNHNDVLAGFSNYGAQIDVCAPGDNVYSSVLNNGYAYYSGTSMATPHTSGLAILLWSYDRTLINGEVWELIRSTAEDKGPSGWDNRYGWGRINADLAIRKAAIPRVIANGYSVLRGHHAAGDLNSLKESDNGRFVVQAQLPQSASDPYVRVLLTSTVPSGTVTSFRFVSEARATLPGIEEVVEFFNYDMNRWDVVARRTLRNTDSVDVVRLSAGFAAYMDGAGRNVQARLSYRPLFSLGVGWEVAIDEARWTVTRS